ncbi:aspartate kinase [Bacillus thermotolerans]|uniref:Aspartokinase n=1 Tax=Bacillus thermotolerans TaxID=1221996 RepID=A0A0F5I6R9_BACTR|nr:aspartate kinase [Bacillus thermotolerans]KKB36170.1 Aspartokinase [Bacillus thermotolerans]KKB41216.1 Aspartokinase [Bacillus thermotolerans]KKB44078.1 Aspartokinase [Bacillus thermotolerans]
MKVSKFGGTSVASASQIKKVAAIVQEDPSRKIVVVSAPGKRFSDDIKVTDLLISLADAALSGNGAEKELQAVVDRYASIAEELGLGDDIIHVIEEDLRGRVAHDKENRDLFVDQMKASGEDNNAKLIAAYFSSIGLEAEYVNPKDAGLVVSDEPGRARALPEAYENLKSLRDRQGIVVFPGFFGFTQEGVMMTFARGGSDITGSILAAATKAELYENFTDVDSVFAANPNVVDSPVEIKRMTYREMRELSYAGFSVLHDEALMPAFRHSVPVCIKNTNNPSAEGTMIVAEREYSKSPVIGIATDGGFSTIYVSKYLMNREIGFGRRLLQILEDEGISYEHTPSGIDDLSIIVRSHQLTPEKEERIMDRCRKELEVDDVHIEHDFAMVVLVGEGMNNTKGLTARATAAITRADANIEMINQGSSEVSLVFGIQNSDTDKVLKELYQEFFSTAAVLGV